MKNIVVQISDENKEVFKEISNKVKKYYKDNNIKDRKYTRHTEIASFYLSDINKESIEKKIFKNIRTDRVSKNRDN